MFEMLRFEIKNDTLASPQWLELVDFFLLLKGQRNAKNESYRAEFWFLIVFQVWRVHSHISQAFTD